MNLYLMRHGIAFETGEAGCDTDESRTLTPEGRDKVSRIAARLAALKVRPSAVITSPLARALQTAEIVAKAVEPSLFDVVEFLEPGGEIDEFHEWLRNCGEPSVLAVGHMPDMAEAAASFLTGTRGLSMVFRKAAVCAISFDTWPGRGRGRLEWFAPPAVLIG